MKNNLSNIYFFNPTCDYAIANGSPWWQPNKLLAKMESDLSTLPALLARNTDVVLSTKIPSKKFIESLENSGFILPQFHEFKIKPTPAYFSQIKIDKLIPWGWSPNMHKRFEPFKKHCSERFKKSPVFTWNAAHKKLSSRTFSLSILQQFLQNTEGKSYITEAQIPTVCNTKKQVEQSIKKWGKIIIKAPWSSSGRGLQPITKTPVHEKVWEKILGTITAQGFVMAEPLLNKVADLAFLFESKNNQIYYLGPSYFFTDAKGQYLGNYINVHQNSNNSITRFQKLVEPEIVEKLTSLLENSELVNNYEGVFGIDTLIFSDENNQLKINPCLEINVRHTMGHLALSLQSHVSSTKQGTFQLFFHPKKSFSSFSAEMKKKFPLKIKNKRIDFGYLPLTEDFPDSRFGAYILV